MLGFFFPPRPSGKIKPSQLLDYEDGNWLCQYKFDGDRCPIQIDQNNVQLWTRKGKKKSRQLCSFFKQQILSLNIPAQESWLDAELIRISENSQRFDVIVLFDALQLGGKYLIGVTQEERLRRLEEVCSICVDEHPQFGYRVGQSVFLAKHWFSNFRERYKETLDIKSLEGLVLRRRDSLLDNYGSVPYEVDWQLRCRNPSVSFRY